MFLESRENEEKGQKWRKLWAFFKVVVADFLLFFSDDSSDRNLDAGFYACVCWITDFRTRQQMFSFLLSVLLVCIFFQFWLL